MTTLEQVEYYGKDIIYSQKYQELSNYMQHGNITVKEHCIHVAIKSIEFVEKYNINCDKKSLIIGCLLHDFFLYDWHDKGNRVHNLHAFKHPNIALDNAKKYFNLNNIEEEIIKKHMWPTTIIPPTKKEVWIIVLIDKICAFQETLNIRVNSIAGY